MNAATNHVQNPIDTTVLANQRNNAGYQDRDNGDVVHAHNAVAHDLKGIQQTKVSVGNTDGQRKHCAANQEQKYIQANQCTNQDNQIRDNANHIIRQLLGRRIICAHRADKKDNRRDNRSRQCNLKVFAELVLHRTALCTCCRDGRIRNHGQVIAKHCTTDRRTNAQCHGNASLLTDANGNRRQCNDRTDRSTHRGRDKAADNEHANNCDVARQNGQTEIDRRVCAARRLYRSGKCTCENEHQTHNHNVLLTSAARHRIQLFLKGQLGSLGILQKCNDQRNQKANNCWQGISEHAAHAIIYDANRDEKHQEYRNREQRPRISFFHSETYFLSDIFHVIFPCSLSYTIFVEKTRDMLLCISLKLNISCGENAFGHRSD